MIVDEHQDGSGLGDKIMEVVTKPSREELINAAPFKGTLYSRHIEEPKEAFYIAVLREPCYNVIYRPRRWEIWRMLAESPEGAMKVAKYHFFCSDDFEYLGRESNRTGRLQGVHGEDVLANVWVSGENKSRWWPGIIVGIEQTNCEKYYDVLLAYWDQDHPMRFAEKDVRPVAVKERLGSC